jgi:iron-sulfur cluster assembly protein
MVGQITITDRAAEKIRKLLTGAKDGYGLRVGVIEGGCSGYEYKMEIDSPGAEDKVFEQNGARVLLGAKSIHHLDGTEMDYKDELMQSGFVFKTPMSKEPAVAALLSAPKEAKATGPVYRMGVLGHCTI